MLRVGWRSGCVCHPKRAFLASLGFAWLCFFSHFTTQAATTDPAPSPRLLTAQQGRSIVDFLSQFEPRATETVDCSHVVHAIYENAGFNYPYQTSTALYAGSDYFLRVKLPRPGDLIVWPGHVGIVVDPAQHSFYSLVRTGLQQQDYEGPYWRARGKPRFYRYRVQNGAVLRTAKASAPPNANPDAGATAYHAARIISVDTLAAGSLPSSNSSGSSPRTTAHRDVPDGQPPASAEPREPDPPSAFSPTIAISAANTLPTREELAQRIAQWTDASASVLRAAGPLEIQTPLVIVAQLRVKHLEFNGDRGSAHVEIETQASISPGAIDSKHHREKLLWELRRTSSGWVALPPPHKNFVSQDGAVKNLAAHLAEISESDAAAAHDPAVLQQESQLAQLLNILLAVK